MKKICWLFDVLGILGASLLLVGLYLAYGLATGLVVAGLMLLSLALRMSYLYGTAG